MRRAAWVAAVALCGGCFSRPAFSGDGGVGDGGSPDTPCTFGAWTPLSPMGEFNGEVTGEPSITRDRLLMVWSQQTTGSPEQWEIHLADRGSTSEPFVVRPGRVAGTAPVIATDPDPSITDDGLTIVYRGGTSSVPMFLQVSRSARAQTTWTEVSVGLSSERPTSLDISADGLTLYWAVGGQNLYSATRSSPTTDDFVKSGALAQDIQWPSISGDQKTLYYLAGAPGTPGGNEVWQMTRGSTSSAFSNPTLVFEGGKDPDVTSDGTAIVVGVDTGIAISERACE